MKRVLSFVPAFAGGLLVALLLESARGAAPQEGQPSFEEVMAQAERYTAPSEHHALLERFLGTWNTETSFVMGGTKTPPEKGRVETTWLMEGRWIQTAGRTRMMGMPVELFGVLGYDNFKQSYVVTSVTSMDTAMNRQEGDLDPSGDTLILYGPIDEYLTGEIGKMTKSVWRFVSEDEMVQEVHDLPIGEENTQVVEIRYRRAE